MKFQFTIRDLLWLLVVIALVLAWRIDRSRVTQWEYKFTYLTVGREDSEMEKFGTEGWEGWAYVAGNQRAVYLKRPKR
jgi:hypothetical protein